MFFFMVGVDEIIGALWGGYGGSWGRVMVGTGTTQTCPRSAELDLIFIIGGWNRW